MIDDNIEMVLSDEEHSGDGSDDDNEDCSSMTDRQSKTNKFFQTPDSIIQNLVKGNVPKRGKSCTRVSQLNIDSLNNLIRQR
jgi:hypothetical protein